MHLNQRHSTVFNEQKYNWLRTCSRNKMNSRHTFKHTFDTEILGNLEKPWRENQTRVILLRFSHRNFRMLQQYRTTLNNKYTWKLCPLHRNPSPLLYSLPATVRPVYSLLTVPMLRYACPTNSAVVLSISVLYAHQLMLYGLYLFCSTAQQ